MDYGHAKHVPAPTDRTIIYCRCGWRSQELTCEELLALGLPWYCDRCDRTGLRFIKFAPHERQEALDIINPPALRAVAASGAGPDMLGGFVTDNLTVKATERLGHTFGWYDPRGYFGSYEVSRTDNKPSPAEIPLIICYRCGLETVDDCADAKCPWKNQSAGCE